jgi:hypothetical protein
MNFDAKVLSKFAASKGLRLTMRVFPPADGAISQQKIGWAKLVLLAWLKGLLSTNRELLFAVPLLWASLNAYLAGLDDASFRSVLLPLH